MKKRTFITRADDAASSRSANAAIAKAIAAGFIKNVSVMAPGAYAEEAASMFAKDRRVCFGLHATINAEWDKVKWGAVSDVGADSGLLDENGMFLSHPKLFLETKPNPETIIAEYDAQLDKLTRLGFDIRYADSHMAPEILVAGLDEAMEDWTKRRGLIHHMYFYRMPPGWETVAQDSSKLLPVLRALPEGQYFFLVHPAFYSDEMLETGNAEVSGEDVAKARDAEAKLVSRRWLKPSMRALGIEPIRYDEATPGPRMSTDELVKILAGETADGD
jgi:hypothetical protein